MPDLTTANHAGRSTSSVYPLAAMPRRRASWWDRAWLGCPAVAASSRCACPPGYVKGILTGRSRPAWLSLPDAPALGAQGHRPRRTALRPGGVADQVTADRLPDARLSPARGVSLRRFPGLPLPAAGPRRGCLGAGSFPSQASLVGRRMSYSLGAQGHRSQENRARRPGGKIAPARSRWSLAFGVLLHWVLEGVQGHHRGILTGRARLIWQSLTGRAGHPGLSSCIWPRPSGCR